MPVLTLQVEMQVLQTELPHTPQPRPQDSPFSALARQLQVRLQYARLKVEHGWQKQNLNEVENLYFHHRHLRDPSNNSRSLEKNASSSKAQSHQLRPNISVFNSRQQPSDILLLHPSDVPEQQETSMAMDNALKMQVDYVMTNTDPKNSSNTTSILPEAAHLPPADLPAENGDDFAPATPRFLEAGEIRSATSDFTVSKAAETVSPSSTPVVGEDDIPKSSQAGDDEPGQMQHATLQVSPECGTNEGAPMKPSSMTYDSFWSSHTNDSTKYGYGTYTTSFQAVQGNVANSMAEKLSRSPVASLPPKGIDAAMADMSGATNV